MAPPPIQQAMMRIAVIVAAAILAAFAASLAYVFFTGVVATVAGLNQGAPMAFSDGFIAVVILLHLSPVVFGIFLLGSFCAGIPTYLILRRMGQARLLTLAGAGALLSGLAAMAVFGAFGPLAILPSPAAGAVGALIFRIVAEQMPWPLTPPPAPPS
jgi:hypothetical protein